MRLLSRALVVAVLAFPLLTAACALHADWICTPVAVSDLAAAQYGTEVTLTWWYGGPCPIEGCRIYWSDDQGGNGQTEVYGGYQFTWVHSDAIPGRTYTYTVAAVGLSIPYQGPGSQVVVPVYHFREPFSYPAGAFVGNGGWTGNATINQMDIVPGGYFRIWGGAGAYTATHTATCTPDANGNIWVRCRINGEWGMQTMWGLWVNDTQGRNFARWYGRGLTCRGRIGLTATVTSEYGLSSAWEEIAVKIDTVNDTSEFFFNGNSIGTLSHASQGCNDTVGYLMFDRVDNYLAAPNHHLYFDDLRLGYF